MKRLLFPIALALLAPSLLAGGDVVVRWRGEDYRSIELPVEMSEAARSAIDVWSEWGEKRSYRMDLSRDGRVLLVSPLRNSQNERQMGLVERVIELFDDKLPAPAERAVIGAPLPGEPGAPAVEEEPSEDEPLPDDPEEEPNPWGDLSDELTGDGSRGAWTKSWAWGAGTVPPDTETIVFFVVRKQMEYRSILSRLAEMAPYLEEWVIDAAVTGGFTLQEPLTGAYVELTDGREEWSPAGELVNRIAGLLLLRRFGQQPYWFTMGWSWTAELEIRGGIYCFPYRDEFVFATEHSGWKGVLGSQFQSRKRPTLVLDEFASWRRGTYLDACARLSWGTVNYLLHRHPDELPDILEALRVLRDKENRVRVSETDWERDRFYTIPLETLDRILREHLGPTYLRDAADFFREDL
jgi:hypothetical protein